MGLNSSVYRFHTDEPWSTTRVRKAQGKPSPSRMSKMLLPMELDTAMSPIPGNQEQDTHGFTSHRLHKTHNRCVPLR